MTLFAEIEKFILKFTWNLEGGTLNNQNNLEKEQN